ncbi:efflux RND transporter periplasmic adaptor subunit, partial [Patescibacteria group bacterium]
MLIKKRYISLIVGLIVIIIMIVVFSRGKSTDDLYVTAKVEKGALRQIVSATGTVMPPSEINLNASITGKIGEMNVEVGDQVEKGQILCKLKTTDLEIQIKEAEANVQAAEADLNKLLQGAKNEDIAVSVVNAEKAKKDYENYLNTFDNIKKQAVQDIKVAEDNLSTIIDKTEKDVKTYEESVTSANQTLNDARTSLINTINTKENAINNAKEDALTTIETKMFVSTASLNVAYSINTDDDIQYELSAKDTSYITQTAYNYELATKAVDEIESLLPAIRENNDAQEIKDFLTNTNDALNKTFNTLLSCYDTLLYSVTSTNLTPTILSAHKTNIKTEQTNISTALTALQTAKQAVDDAVLDYDSSIDTSQSTVNTKESSLKVAQANLALSKITRETKILEAENNLTSVEIASEKKINDGQTNLDSYYNQWKLMEKQMALKESSPLSSEISLYRARIQQMEAKLSIAKENLSKTSIIAPIDGIITDKNYEIGEQTSLATPIFSMSSLNKYEIEVAIPESDIIKVKVGQKVFATMDAYDDDIKFIGEIMFIEPAETIIQDVVYYKVKISLDETEYAIKSGMTANVDIETAKKENSLMVPQR